MLLRELPRRVVRALIRVYAYLVSPLMARSCRFHPTCSHYADEAVARHGALKGVVLTGRRLLQCHPYGRRPFLDPVPEAIDWKTLIRYKTGIAKTTDEDATNP